jgi:hypothetical protein
MYKMRVFNHGKLNDLMEEEKEGKKTSLFKRGEMSIKRYNLQPIKCLFFFLQFFTTS